MTLKFLPLKNLSLFLFAGIVSFFLFFPSGGFCKDKSEGRNLQNSFIWADNVPVDKQVYVEFRKNITLSGAPQKALINIFADSRYILWINGKYVDRGPGRFDPKIPEYDTIDFTKYLKSGNNAVAVLVHHYHDGLANEDSASALNGRIMRHEPGLTAEIDIYNKNTVQKKIVTDTTWLVNTNTCYKPSPISWGWIPDIIDARIQKDDWTAIDFDDKSWEKPVKVDGKLWGQLHARSIPLLKETEITPSLILQPELKTFTEDLPITLKPGEKVIIDVGQSVLAYQIFDIDSEDGAVMEIKYGHGYRNNALDEVYGANLYTACDGKQIYMTNDTCGFRYMQISSVSGKIKIDNIKIVNRIYPFDIVGKFNSNDDFLDELWERSVKTLTLCSEDGYTDCTARERAEWMGDSALIEYPLTRVVFAGPGQNGVPVYSDPRLIKMMLEHIAASQKPDGRLKAHHPSDRMDVHWFIDDYSCLWVKTLYEYYINTGDTETVKELWGNLTKQMEWFLKQREPDGLVKGREFVFFDNPLAYKVCEGTSLNAAIAGALNYASLLGEIAGDKKLSRKYKDISVDITKKLNDFCYDETSGGYYGGIVEGKRADLTFHATMLMLYYDLVPREHLSKTVRWTLEHRDKIGSPYSCAYYFEDLYKASEKDFDSAALEIMRTRWASTLERKDLDTVFESFGKPSYCHNAGASPAYYLSAYVLGARPSYPLGKKRIIIDPRPGNLEHASGVAVTELGPVNMKWEKQSDKFILDFTVPEGTKPEIHVYAKDKNLIRCNNKIKFLGDKDGKIVFETDGTDNHVEVMAE